MTQNTQKEHKTSRQIIQKIVIGIIIVILLLIGGCAVKKVFHRTATDPEPSEPKTEEPVPGSQYEYNCECDADTYIVYAPTCIDDGYTLHYHNCCECCKCCESYKDNFQPALGHQMVKGTVIGPTEKSYGYTIYTCSRCGVIEKRNFVSKLKPSGTATIPEQSKPLSPDELEKIQQEIDAKVSLYMMNISMACNPEFEGGMAEGWLKIYNSSQNQFPQIIKIFRNDTGELIYTSSVIPVGSRIDTDTLDVNLPAGDYDCTAYFFAVDDQSGQELSCACANIVITIKN